MRSSLPATALALSAALLIAGCRPDTLWAPDGKSLAVAAPSGLYRFDLAREKFEPLVRGPQRVLNPAWSPDGKRLCYFLTTSQRGKVTAASLAVLDLQTRKQTLLVPKLALPEKKPGPLGNPGVMLKQVFTASWSPDAKRIAYITFQAGRSVLAVVPSSGGPAKLLTTPPHEALSPAWSPAGTEIAYLVEERGKPGPAGIPASHGPITVHSIQPDGKGHRLLWSPPAGLGLNPVPLGPQWARNGKSLAVVAEKIPTGSEPQGPAPDLGASSEVWTLRREGGSEKLADVPGAAIGASLSADLRSIVFFKSSTERQPKQLDVMLLTAPYKEPKPLFALPIPAEPPSGGGGPERLESLPIPILSPDGSRAALLDALSPGGPRLLLASPGDKEPHSYPLPVNK